MARLSTNQIRDLISAKGKFSLVSDEGYENIHSRILVRCDKGHLFETCIADVRHPSFACPQCNRHLDFINPAAVPQKRGYRLIAFDQATEKFGLSIYEDGKLIFYSLYQFSGDVTARLSQINKFVRDIVIAQWKPDYIVMEDIQYQQNGLMTFKVLAMLLGICEIACRDNDVPYEVVSPNVWRKYAGTAGKTRREEKLLSVGKVKEQYGVVVSDDIAEAILIGSYGIRMHQGAPLKMAFGGK